MTQSDNTQINYIVSQRMEGDFIYLVTEFSRDLKDNYNQMRQEAKGMGGIKVSQPSPGFDEATAKELLMQ